MDRHRFDIVILSVVVGIVLHVFAGCVSAGDANAGREAEEVIGLMTKVRDYQRAHPYRPLDHNWIRATYYTGLMAMYRATKDPDILAQATQWAQKHQWREGSEKLPANKKTCGQTYLELYFIKPQVERIAAIRDYVDRRMEKIAAGESPLEGWHYVDTLYVGPPTITMLGKATGQQKYYDYMNKVYWSVFEHLFDREYGLFYRDKRFFDAKTSNGRKVFWSRGNGWAFAGIPRVLSHLPRDNEFRGRYVELLRTMAASLARRQGEDGLWRSNLDDPDQYPNPETSGSSFFCYGLAWGVNEGLLDKAVYLPVVVKAWDGLKRCVHPDGKLGFVQRVAGAPGGATRDETHEYAMGAFLLAGSEMVRLLRSEITLSAADLIGAASADDPKKEEQGAGSLPAGVKLFATNGGWCWYQDPRAIIHDGKLIVGSASGSGEERGDVRVSVYDLKADRDLGTFVLHPRLESDDHCTPAFYVRPDNRIMAMYALHTSKKHYYRMSMPGDPTTWGPEQAYDHPAAITYMNLYYHPCEKLLYNFYRDNSRSTWCPFFMVSPDHGQTWRAGGQLIQHEVKGTHRPYPRYSSDGEFIHVCFTEAHPQEYPPCSIYYAKYKAGKFYRANGTLIKDIRKEGPLLPRQAEQVFVGDPQNGAWTSSIVADRQGKVYIAYSVRKSPADHRFRYANWDGGKWNDHEVAFAGPGLYPRAYDYTGRITIDPSEPGRVYFSTNVTPKTGTRGAGKHEIYEGLTQDSGETWKITALTKDSPTDNLRPICVTGEGFKALLWLRGRYATYTSYDQNVVGMIAKLANSPSGK